MLKQWIETLAKVLNMNNKIEQTNLVFAHCVPKNNHGTRRSFVCYFILSKNENN